MTSPRVVVYRGHDPIALELVEAHLRGADIPYIRVGRGSAALLGAGTSAVEQLIEVESEHAEAARALLVSQATANVSDAAPGAEGAQQQGVSRRERFVAVALVVLWSGLATAYVGFPLTGLLFAASSFYFFVTTGSDEHPLGAVLFLIMLPRLLELLGTQLWLRKRGRNGPAAWIQALLALTVIVSLSTAHRTLSPQLSDWSTEVAREQKAAAIRKHGCPPGTATANAPVDINEADYAELLTLPGIGQAEAEHIVYSRDAYGPYLDLDEITDEVIPEELVFCLREVAYAGQPDE